MKGTDAEYSHEGYAQMKEWAGGERLLSVDIPLSVEGLTTTIPAKPPFMTSSRTDIARLQALEADSQSDLAIAELSVCNEFYSSSSATIP